MGNTAAKIRRNARWTKVKKGLLAIPSWILSRVMAIFRLLPVWARFAVILIGGPALLIFGGSVPWIAYAFGVFGVMLWAGLGVWLIRGTVKDLVMVCAASFGAIPLGFLYFSVFAVRLLIDIF